MWIQSSLIKHVACITLLLCNFKKSQCKQGVQSVKLLDLTESVAIKARVIGGHSVDIKKYPHVAQFLNLGSLCAGSILNSWTVLTAAHCFDYNKNIDDMMIETGARYVYEFNATTYDPVKFIIHEDYNKSTIFDCDIALIFVDGPIIFGDKVRKVILVNNNKWMNSNEHYFVVTGFGWTKYGGPLSEQGLMSTTLRYVTLNRCRRLHKMKMTQSMFCLYGDGVRDSCKGDSGGGVLWNGMLVGIVSHADGCAKKNKPSVYTNVWYFRKWIQYKVVHFIKTYCKD